MRRHDVQRLQPFAAPELNRFLQQLDRRRRGEGAVKQCQRHKADQQGFTQRGQQRRRLLQMALIDVERGLQPSAGQAVDGKEAFAAVANQVAEEVEGAEQNAAPHHFVTQEARQGDVADNQRQQNGDRGQRQRHLNQSYQR